MALPAGSGGGQGRSGILYRGLRRAGTPMMGEINVTPLVDVVLVLLLVFMVTAPMMSRGIDVSLPQADQPQIPPDNRLTVSVNAQGTIFIGDKPVNIVLLEEEVRGRLAGQTD